MSLYYYCKKKHLNWLLSVYVDETLTVVNSKLKDWTKNVHSHFKSKPRKYFPIFLVFSISRSRTSTFSFNRTKHIQFTKLGTNAKCEEFRITKYKIVWISHTKRKYLAGMSILAQVTNKTFHIDDKESVTRSANTSNSIPKLGLRYDGFYFKHSQSPNLLWRLIQWKQLLIFSGHRYSLHPRQKLKSIPSFLFQHTIKNSSKSSPQRRNIWKGWRL